ncbi:alpha-hydroxy-acid oxidizing protein [Halostella litorea]|uniref:alpha-hydroxy-acid oxidizing protein n=1 Tax=Halostella litorea TaxID=2528831 RepID=UPI001092EAAF|nr:alpha-hydroxy-acid oxidizing protein [Halostella litorea]
MAEDYGYNRQVEVYTTRKATGETPDYPVAYEELKAAAEAELSDEAYAYVAGGAGGEETKRSNRRAIERWRIRPRMLQDVTDRTLSTEVLGTEFPVPAMLAPVGVQSIIHDEGELATARAAAETGVPFAHSTAASSTMEAVADELGGTPGWFQLYWSSDDDLTASLLERAEAAGYEAVVVTLDTPLLGWRERDIDLGYLPFMEGEGVANYFEDPVFRESLSGPPEENVDAAVAQFLDVFSDASHTWEDLADLAGMTDLPVVVKGVLHPEDAALALDHGADGVVVSNHGGRQVDGAVAAAEALPDVRERVGPDVPVLFDSGIRRGADAVRALALGADAVLLGRPYVYGLALGGQAGVAAVVDNFLADLDLTVALSGVTDVADLDRSALAER